MIHWYTYSCNTIKRVQGIRYEKRTCIFSFFFSTPLAVALAYYNCYTYVLLNKYDEKKKLFVFGTRSDYMMNLTDADTGYGAAGYRQKSLRSQPRCRHKWLPRNTRHTFASGRFLIEFHGLNYTYICKMSEKLRVTTIWF